MCTVFNLFFELAKRDDSVILKHHIYANINLLFSKLCSVLNFHSRIMRARALNYIRGDISLALINRRKSFSFLLIKNINPGSLKNNHDALAHSSVVSLRVKSRNQYLGVGRLGRLRGATVESVTLSTLFCHRQ